MRKVIRKVTIRCWSGRRVCRMRLEVKVSRRAPRQTVAGSSPQRFQWRMSFSDGASQRWRREPRGSRGTRSNGSSSERPMQRRRNQRSASSFTSTSTSEVSRSGGSSTCINCDLLVDKDQAVAAAAGWHDVRGGTDSEETDHFLGGSVYSENQTSSIISTTTSDANNQNQNQNQVGSNQTDSNSDSDLAAAPLASDKSQTTGSRIACFFCSNTDETIVNAANADNSSTTCRAELESAGSGPSADRAAAKLAATISEEPALEEAADDNDGGKAGGDDEAADADAEQDSGVASSESTATKQAELRRFYEAELELAAQLNRTIVDPEFEAIDMRLVRRNLRLVKQRRHPTQILMETCRQEEMGVNRLQQLLMERRIKQYKLALDSGTGQADSPSSRAATTAAAYPEWLTFKLRIKKEQGDHRWLEFVRHHGQLRAEEPISAERMASVKESQKYSQEYIDVWTNHVTVLVKSGATFGDALRAAFLKLGLEHRADFKFTIGCFLGHARGERSGNGPKAPVEIFEATPVLDLYRQNASEVFVNSNKLQMYRLFPEFFEGGPAAAAHSPGHAQSNKKRKRKGRCC